MSNHLTLWTTLLGALFCLQLGWWGYLLWSGGDDLRDSEFARLQASRQSAQRHFDGIDDGGADGASAWESIASRYPHLVHVPGSTPSIQVGSASLAALDTANRGWKRMIVGEGALFLVIGLLGLYLFVRVARRESYLALQQSNFLHAVTHEFRSPLQSLRLAAETQTRRPSSEKAATYAAGMLEDVGRLEGLVENVLSVGRLDAEAFRASPRSLDLSAAVRRTLERLEPSKPDEIEIADGVLAEADESTLEPIIRNLLDNARKYGEGTPVVLKFESQPPYATVEVSDAGRGFTAEERRHLFERFWRAGDERVRTAPGAGLGLFLVQTLARAQGAQVDARSDGPGQGARFTVRWPLSSVEEPE